MAALARLSEAPPPPSSKPRARPTPPLHAEDWLALAMNAASAEERRRLARRGLAQRAPLDRTTQAMLLRQVYLGSFELGQLRRAYTAAEQAIDTGVMPDVMHADAARAATALGWGDRAVEHLRTAARSSPASRRAFHFWTLGSTLLLLGRAAEAEGALERAVRWGATDKPLYRAHATLARLAAGEAVRDARRVYNRLAEAPCGHGYGRYVLGMLALHLGEVEVAREHLTAFLARTRASRRAMQLALAGEVREAERGLGRARGLN